MGYTKSFKQLKKSSNKTESLMAVPLLKLSPTANITFENVKQQVDLLIASSELKNMPIYEGLGLFYIASSHY